MIGCDFTSSYRGVPADSDGEDDLVIAPRAGLCSSVPGSTSDASTRDNGTLLASHSTPPIAHFGVKSLWSGFDQDCQICLVTLFSWCVDATDAHTEFAECMCNGDGFGGTLRCKTICISKDMIQGTFGPERNLAPGKYKKCCTGENSGSG
ncbi:hypothetical protein DL765_003149 [Monosporascus sp. GIB2]|nr:hypothetical protein DL765_003149 [Monosporascus sp. GIB2]